ncbi:MAG: penicillin-binding protein activator [Candidatus Diapherotrites archaeon]|nr:penicillin-binding protein activator [Candidatus Diapherotrites archaeon]
MAIDKIRKETINGRKLKFVFEDDKCDAKEALSIYNKTTGIDKAKIITGTVCSATTLAIGPLAQRDKLLLISAGSSNPKIRYIGNYVFSLWPLDDEEGRAIAEYLQNKTQYRKISVIYINNEYGVGLKDAFTKEASTRGLEVASLEAFATDAQDFKTIIEKMQNTSPDAIYIISNPEELPLLLKQLKELQVAKPLFVNGVAVETKSILEDNPYLGEGIIYAMPKSELTPEFKAKYKAKYGTDAGILSDKAYDAMQIILLALKKCGGDDTTCMSKYIHSIREYKGASAELSFRELGSVSMPFEIKEIKEGKPARIE